MSRLDEVCLKEHYTLSVVINNRFSDCWGGACVPKSADNTANGGIARSRSVNEPLVER